MTSSMTAGLIRIICCFIFLCIVPGTTSKEVPPKIIHGAKNSDLSRGNRYQLLCTAKEGDLPMTFRWMRNGQTLSALPDITVRRLDDYSSSLVIESVTEYHSSNYSCVVSNAAGKDSFTVQLQVNVPPFWIQQPIDSMVTMGDDLKLPCNAGGNPLPKVVWKKSKGILSPSFQEIQSDDRHRINEEGTLTIHRVIVEDENYYSCEVNNGAGEIKKTVKIDVLVPPQVPEKFVSVTKKKGQNVDLKCNMTGDKPLKLDWKRNDADIQTSLHSRMSINEKKDDAGVTSLLQLQEVRADDSDLYICIGQNTQGKNEMRFRLIIIVIPPKLIQKTGRKGDDKVEIAKGHRYQEVCTVSKGDLPLTFRWLKNGQTLVSNAEITLTRINDYSSSLSIEAVTEYNSGNYSCVVSNGAGKDSYTVLLQVNVPPYWIRQPVDTTVVVAQGVNLDCLAGGFPTPVSVWKKVKGHATENVDVKSNGGLKINEEGSLVVSRSKGEHEGYYLCEVSNGIGEGIKKTVKIDVLVPPQVGEKFQSLTQKKGQMAEMLCNVTGDKPLTIKWKKEATFMSGQSGDRWRVKEQQTNLGTESLLTIEDISAKDNALFVCTVQNQHGQAEMQFRLTVVEAPGKVDHLKLLQTWSRSIRISWQIPYSGNSPVTKVFVEYIETEKENSKEPKHKTVKPTETSAVVENLKPWTSYKISITAENIVGKSPASNPLTVTTREEEPSSAPVDLKVESVGATKARFSWKPLRKRDWSGQPLGYYLSYKSSGTSQPYAGRSVPLSLNKTVQTFVLDELQRSTGYTVRVQAFNDAGVGPASETVNFRTKSGAPPSAPKMKLNSVEPPSAFFEIKPGLTEDEISEFLIHVRRHSKEWEEIAVSVTPTNVYTLGGLTRDSQYQVYVTARNLFGKSEASKELTFNTPKTGFFHFDDIEPLYAKMSVVIPVAASVLLVIVACITACCLSRKTSPKRPKGMTVNDFAYTAPSSSRSESSFYPQVRTSLSRVPPSTRSVYTESRVYSSVDDYEEPKYECVVEEMKTFIGSTKMNPKSVPT